MSAAKKRGKNSFGVLSPHPAFSPEEGDESIGEVVLPAILKPKIASLKPLREGAGQSLKRLNQYLIWGVCPTMLVSGYSASTFNTMDTKCTEGEHLLTSLPYLQLT